MAFAGMTSGYVVSRTTLVANEQWITCFAASLHVQHHSYAVIIGDILVGQASL